MKRILLRSPKSPFEAVSPRRAFTRNLIGDNSGNLIFLHAAHKILARSDVEVHEGGWSVDPDRADEVNERYDAYVMPLANAFRLTFEPNLERMARFIERLRIPVSILGVGAQAGLDYRVERLRPIEATVKRFVSAVLDRAPSIGVRGELTESYLRSLGFRDVEAIGCPSMFLHGDRLAVEKRLPALDRSARLSINVSPYVKAMKPLIDSHLERYPNLTYVAQDIDTLGRLVRGEAPDPGDITAPLHERGQIRFYVEPWPWMADLAIADFAFGSRIHGNVTALLAGTPAYVFAHDARTLELARYFEIPHRRMSDVRPDADAAELYAEADYTALTANHAARFAVFTDYLRRHGLSHVFESGQSPAAFDQRIAAQRFPGAVTVSALPKPLARGRYELTVFAGRAAGKARRSARGTRERVRRAVRRAPDD